MTFAFKNKLYIRPKQVQRQKSDQKEFILSYELMSQTHKNFKKSNSLYGESMTSPQNWLHLHSDYSYSKVIKLFQKKRL